MPKKVEHFKILPIKHLLKNNTLASSGEVFLGTAFVNLELAMESGICEETKEELTSKASKQAKTVNLKDVVGRSVDVDGDSVDVDSGSVDVDGGSVDVDVDGVDLSKMNKKELLAFSKENEVTIPQDTRKAGREAIVDFLIEKLNEGE